MLVYAQVNTSETFLKTHTSFFSTHVGDCVCNRVRVVVVKKHPGTFLGIQFSIYSRLSLHITVIRIKLSCMSIPKQLDIQCLWGSKFVSLEKIFAPHLVFR